jgi:chromatin remodeling complex protein RSC6
MQTRSGKTYNATASSSKGKNNIRLKMKVDNVDNRVTLRMQTRSGKTYTATSCSAEKNNIKLEIKVDNVENVVTRTTPTPSSTRRPISTNRVPCGFVRPQKISNELAEFLGKPVGTEMVRTDVSRLINSYIRNNNLQDPQNGRIINPDTKLRALLKVGENDELSYFNLQSYMRPHFIREDNVENVVSRPSFTQSTPSSNDRRPLGFTGPTDRRPSGFVTPTKISDELANFLGKPVGTEMARTDVSRHINSYVRDHNLQDPRNGRRINPDTKLRALLRIGQNEELTYFNLQKYMKHHFIREN